MAAVWPDTTVEEANLTVQISSLRRILDAERRDGKLHPDFVRPRLSVHMSRRARAR